MLILKVSFAILLVLVPFSRAYQIDYTMQINAHCPAERLGGNFTKPQIFEAVVLVKCGTRPALQHKTEHADSKDKILIHGPTQNYEAYPSLMIKAEVTCGGIKYEYAPTKVYDAPNTVGEVKTEILRNNFSLIQTTTSRTCGDTGFCVVGKLDMKRLTRNLGSQDTYIARCPQKVE